MGDDDREYELRLRQRQRRATVRAAIELPREAFGPSQPDALAGEPTRTTQKIRSFRARAESEFAKERELTRDLEALLRAVLGGRRDAALAAELGTDRLGLRDLEHRFLLRTGKSVYVAAVEVVNRANRMRRDTIPE